MLDDDMRLFVGLDLPDEIRDRIAQFMAEMRGLAPDVRWVKAESLHVTLKFIGEKPDRFAIEIQKALASIAAPSFEIAFRGSGFFPTPRAARVFWIGIKADAALPQLAGKIDASLAQIRIPKETRAFSPHLSVARAGSGAPPRQQTDGKNLRFAQLQERLAQVAASHFGTMLARDFFLYRSHLSSQGSRYEKLARFELHSPER